MGIRLLALLAVAALVAPALAAPCATVGGTTALDSAARGLGAREWCDFNSNLTRAMVGGCGGGAPNLTTYADSMAWDSLNRQVHFEGNRHAGAPRRIVYDEASNSWSSWSSYAGSGICSGGYPDCTYNTGGITDGTRGSCNWHAYDHNTADNSGWLYFRPFGARYMRYWNGSSWNSTSSCPTSVCPTSVITGGIEYFPERNSVVWIPYLDRIVEWQKASATWVSLASSPSLAGSYDYALEYNPVHRVMWAMSGQGATASSKLAANGAVTALGAAPLGLGVTVALVTVDPVGGYYIVYRKSDGAWFQYDIIADTWTTFSTLGITSMPPLVTGNAQDNIEVSIPDRNVMMFVVYDAGNSQSKTYLYRHTASTPTVPPAAPTNLRVN